MQHVSNDNNYRVPIMIAGLFPWLWEFILIASEITGKPYLAIQLSDRAATNCSETAGLLVLSTLLLKWSSSGIILLLMAICTEHQTAEPNDPGRHLIQTLSLEPFLQA
jgi:hypothetical protein